MKKDLDPFRSFRVVPALVLCDSNFAKNNFCLKMSTNGVHDPSVLQFETVWLEANRFQEAEERYAEHMAVKTNEETSLVQEPRSVQERQVTPAHQVQDQTQSPGRGASCKALPSTSLACEIANARQKIQNFMKSVEHGNDLDNTETLANRMQRIEKENRMMRETIEDLRSQMQEALQKINYFVTKFDLSSPNTSHLPESPSVANHADSPVNNVDDEDDGVDLFGSDEETEEDRRVKEERLKAYQNKKAKKPALVAKSSVVLDVKPWDDETNMQEVEAAVRKIELDGLKWGAGKLVPLAYGIKKLQIVAIVEDDKVSVDGLQESIEEITELVQSVDIAAFNKL